MLKSKQDLQRRKEEMAQAVEATRKRLEAVSKVNNTSSCKPTTVVDIHVGDKQIVAESFLL